MEALQAATDPEPQKHAFHQPRAFHSGTLPTHEPICKLPVVALPLQSLPHPPSTTTISDVEIPARETCDPVRQQDTGDVHVHVHVMSRRCANRVEMVGHTGHEMAERRLKYDVELSRCDRFVFAFAFAFGPVERWRVKMLRWRSSSLPNEEEDSECIAVHAIPEAESGPNAS